MRILRFTFPPMKVQLITKTDDAELKGLCVKMEKTKACV